jgi:prepilin-type N-terminal cleavage/methylation domain-containing protein
MTRSWLQQLRPRRAFTLVELLVVLVVIAIVVTMTTTAMNPLTRSSNTSAARRSLSAAGDLTRAYSTRSIADLGAAGGVPGAKYSGAAAIFEAEKDRRTGAAEIRIRIAENFQRAKDGDTFLEMDGRNGYRAIGDGNTLSLPGGFFIRGIKPDGEQTSRFPSSPLSPGEVQVGPAIVFNEHGNLVTPAGTERIRYQKPGDNGGYDDKDNDFSSNDLLTTAIVGVRFGTTQQLKNDQATTLYFSPNAGVTTDASGK